VFHVRLVLPPRLTPRVRDHLADQPTVTNLIVLTGAAVAPHGDAVLFDVAREAVSPVLHGLRRIGVDPQRDDTSVALEEVQAMPGVRAELAERAAPGAPDDAIVWEIVRGRAADDTRSSWSFHAFLCLATMIAAVAVITDSPVLVVGAMVVGPEFGPVSALAVALVLRLWRLAWRAIRLLVLGFALAIAVTALLALVARSVGWISPADLMKPRPLTQYIWRPDKWSIVVALLAGAAGVLSVTAGRTNVLVGVFISVTTVPAAGNLAVALALVDADEVAGSALQLVVNLVGMTIAGYVVLSVQRLLTAHRERETELETGA